MNAELPQTSLAIGGDVDGKYDSLKNILRRLSFSCFGLELPRRSQIQCVNTSGTASPKVIEFIHI